MRIKPKKNLGQNFLVERNIALKIVSALGLKESDTVVEIGAGKGENTAQIAAKVKNLYALELDRRLYPVLEDRLKVYPNARLIREDVLKFDFTSIKSAKGSVKAFGNIPYYITTAIIERLIQFRACLSEAFITVQKEFAARLVAGPGSKEYGSLSCYVQYYAQPEIALRISRGCFYPVPKVDSALLHLKFRDKPAVCVQDEAFFFKIIRASFNQRRKILRNSLEGVVDPAKLAKALDEGKLRPNARPEELSLENFAFLANFLA